MSSRVLSRATASTTTPPSAASTPPQRPHVDFVEISPANLAPYVIGLERSYFHDIRTFALDRMTHVRVLDDRYEVPDDFDPHTYLSSTWGIVAGPPLEVRLHPRPTGATFG